MPTPTPTAYEQYSLELINRARLDPLGEVDALITDAASRTGVTADITFHLQYLGVDMALLRSQMAEYDTVAPLAWNTQLAAAAEGHSDLLAANNSQSHQEPGELGLGDRIRATGYEPWRWSENVFSYGKDPVFTHAAFIIDWGYGVGGMQDGAGHRNAMLDARVMEVGIGAVADSDGATGPWVVTQDFARPGNYQAQLLGVVINDTDNDDFYDIGEGMGGITVTATSAAGTWSTSTWDSGGYQMILPQGAYTVTYSGGGLGGTVTRSLSFDATQNVKIDVEKADAGLPAPTPAPAPTLMPDGYLAGTDAADTVIGSSGDDAIFAGAGADLVQGGLGDDLVSGEAFDASFDPEAMAVYRLYAATLGREPGRDGLALWADQLAQGRLDLGAAAANFVGSDEFQSRFDAAASGDFIDLLYHNVLGRAGNETGRAYWSDLIDSGAASRADVVTGFSESAEHVAKTLPGSLKFTHSAYQADWADDVYRLFGATLGRTPGAAGIEYWSGELADGRSFQSVIDGFVGSAEFAERFGGLTGAPGTTGGAGTLSAADFVTLLFHNVLGRDGTAAGQDYWTQKIVAAGASVSQVVSEFAQSGEYVANTADAFEIWSANSEGDRLNGGAGNNTLFGGVGADTFVFAKANGGLQTVADLSAHDRIELQGFDYANAGEALSHVSADANGNAVFSDQGVQIVFVGVAPTDLHADQFLF